MNAARRISLGLLVVSALLALAIGVLRTEGRSIGTIKLAEDVALGIYGLLALCAINLVFLVVCGIRARQTPVRPIAFTLVAALLPFFTMAFCSAAGIGGR